MDHTTAPIGAGCAGCGQRHPDRSESGSSGHHGAGFGLVFRVARSRHRHAAEQHRLPSGRDRADAVQRPAHAAQRRHRDRGRGSGGHRGCSRGGYDRSPAPVARGAASRASGDHRWRPNGRGVGRRDGNAFDARRGDQSGQLHLQRTPDAQLHRGVARLCGFRRPGPGARRADPGRGAVLSHPQPGGPGDQPEPRAGAVWLRDPEPGAEHDRQRRAIRDDRSQDLYRAVRPERTAGAADRTPHGGRDARRAVARFHRGLRRAAGRRDRRLHRLFGDHLGHDHATAGTEPGARGGPARGPGFSGAGSRGGRGRSSRLRKHLRARHARAARLRVGRDPHQRSGAVFGPTRDRRRLRILQSARVARANAKPMG